MGKVHAPLGSGKGVSSGVGDVEVHSTPTHTILRLRGRDDQGPVTIEVDLSCEKAIAHAAQVMFCAMRHAPDPDAAVEMFMEKLDGCGRGLAMQAIMAPRKDGAS